jgi:AcrR family transcriptional regulator
MSAASPSKASVPDKRAAILETTLDLISTRGFHNTPMSAIAKQSGVSTGIIYHYFTGKEALIFELYKEIKYKMIQTVLEGYSEQNSYRERFLLLWHALIRYCVDHQKELKFLEQFENSPYYDPNRQEIFVDELGPFIKSFFEQGVRDGVLKDIPLEIGAELSFGVAMSLAKQHVRGMIQLDDALMNVAANASWDAIKG